MSESKRSWNKWWHVPLLALIIGAASSILGLELSLLRHATHLSRSPEFDSLYHVQLDHWRRRNEWDRDSRFIPDGDPPDQLTYRDAMALGKAPVGGRRMAFYEFASTISPDAGTSERPIVGAATHADFFAMVGARFSLGGPWTEPDEVAGRVAVLSQQLNDELFNGRDSVGRLISIGGVQYRVVGVLARWRPSIKFYSASIYSPMNQLYIPQQQAVVQGLSPFSRVVCSLRVANTLPDLADSECAWIQFWIELPGAESRRQFELYLLDYIASQKLIHRIPRPPNILLLDAQQWTQRMAAASGVLAALVPATTLTVLLALITINAIGNWLQILSADLSAHRTGGPSARGLIAWLAPLIAVVLAHAELAYLRAAAEDKLQLQGWSLESIGAFDWTLTVCTAFVAATVFVLSMCYTARWLKPLERLETIQPKQAR
jgi:putative ABC transport system permease protein